jgi:hypothetical protein
MPTTQVIFGPNDTLRLLSAGTIRPVHRIQAEITTNALGVVTQVIAYPIDSRLIEITGGAINHRINGCPYPPDCVEVSFFGDEKEAKDCRIEIGSKASALNVV